MKQSIKSKLKRAAMYLLGFSATPMLTACYGIAYDEEINHVPFEGLSGGVYDAHTGNPIPGIKVSVRGSDIYTTTNKEGLYYIDQHFNGAVYVRAEDIDGEENGEFFYSEKHVTTLDNHDANFTLQKAN